MQRLIHDMNSALSELQHYQKKMAEWLKLNGKAIVKADGKTDSFLWVLDEYFKRCHNNLKEAIDLYYDRFSRDFADTDDPGIVRTPKKILAEGFKMLKEEDPLQLIEALQKEIVWLRKRKNQAYESMRKLCEWYRDHWKREEAERHRLWAIVREEFKDKDKRVGDKDHFAISFAVWLRGAEGQMYEATGMSAYALLEKYKSRPYIEMDSDKQ